MLGVFQVEKKINDDLGFLYLNSILSEFHTGQNSALKIMENDNKDKEVLMAITSYDLVEMIDIKELERLQNDIENLDLVEDFETNQKLIALVDETYKGFLSESEAELEELNSIAKNQIKQRESLGIDLKNFETLQPFFDENGLKEDGLEQTSEKLNDFNDSLSNFNDSMGSIINDDHIGLKKVSGKLNQILGGIEALINKDKDELTGEDGEDKTVFEKLMNQVDQMNQSLSDQEEKIDNIIKSYDKQVKEYDLNGIFAKSVFQKYQEVKNNQNSQDPFVIAMDDIFDKLNNHRVFQQKLEAYFQSLNNQDAVSNSYTFENYLNYVISDKYEPIDLTNELREVEQEQAHLTRNEIGNSIQYVERIIEKEIGDELKDVTGLLDKIEKELSGKMDHLPKVNDIEILKEVDKDLADIRNQQELSKKGLTDAFDTYRDASDDFVGNKLGVYNPLTFIEEGKIQSIISDYQMNVAQIDNKIMNKNSEYLQFVNASYRNADEHILSLREDIQKHQQASEEKIDKGLAQAKQIKETTSSINQKLMGSFVTKLPYTRVGSVENTLVYDFIVSPMTMEGSIHAKTNGASYDLLLIAILVFIFVGVLYILLYFMNIRKKGEETTF